MKFKFNQISGKVGAVLSSMAAVPRSLQKAVMLIDLHASQDDLRAFRQRLGGTFFPKKNLHDKVREHCSRLLQSEKRICEKFGFEARFNKIYEQDQMLAQLQDKKWPDAFKNNLVQEAYSLKNIS